jgi:hypothetical protein
MQTTVPDQAPQAATQIVIFINDERFRAPVRVMTGAEIKRLGDVPPGNRLYREEPGAHPDTAIPDDMPVQLKSGEKFYDLPPGTVGGSLLPSVEVQIHRLREDYAEVEVRPQPDGSTQVVVGPVRLGDAWSRTRICVLFFLPLGYPQARPGGFFAEADVRLAAGGEPAGSGQQQVAGEQWRAFCWQPTQWDHDRETLWRYVKFCERRFAEEHR